MARPRSKTKPEAILQATASLIAKNGLAASTSAIAKHAGVADGTLFVYFKTKQDLLNALFVHLKQELRASVDAEGAEDLDLESRARLSWNRYINWGVNNPTGFSAMKQLDVSDVITNDTRAELAELFPESRDLSSAASETSPAAGLGPRYVDSLFNSLAEMTVDLILENPDKADDYRNAGFLSLWIALGH